MNFSAEVSFTCYSYFSNGLYSNEKYTPYMFPNGDWLGTVEEAFDIGAVYLM